MSEPIESFCFLHERWYAGHTCPVCAQCQHDRVDRNVFDARLADLMDEIEALQRRLAAVVRQARELEQLLRSGQVSR